MSGAKIGKLSVEYKQIPKLNWAWTCTQLGVLILPIVPALGSAGLVLAIAIVWRLRYEQIIRYPLNWIIGILSSCLVISCLFAAYPQEAWLGLANFLPYFALFAALTILIRQPFQLKRIAWLLTLPVIPIVILGLGQLWGGWSSPPPLPFLLGWELVPYGIPPERMASVFIYANFLAVYLLLGLIFSLGLAIATYQARQKAAWQLWWLGATILSSAVGLILTSSRNAWGLAFLAGLAFAIYLGWQWLIWAVGAIATVILWASFGLNPIRDWLRQFVPAYFWARLSDRMYPDRPIETLRTTQWQFCWDLVQQRPWTGWGLRNFTLLYEQKMNVWMGHPHSLFLMLMAETGIIASLLLMVIVGWVLFQGIVVSRTQSTKKPQERSILFTYLVAFASIILFNLFDVTVFDLRINILGWLLLSSISGVVYHHHRENYKIGRYRN